MLAIWFVVSLITDELNPPHKPLLDGLIANVTYRTHYGGKISIHSIGHRPRDINALSGNPEQYPVHITNITYH